MVSNLQDRLMLGTSTEVFFLRVNIAGEPLSLRYLKEPLEPRKTQLKAAPRIHYIRKARIALLSAMARNIFQTEYTIMLATTQSRSDLSVMRDTKLCWIVREIVPSPQIW